MNKSLSSSDKRNSKTHILKLLHSHGPMARIALTRLTGLSRATISTCISELIESQLVCEAEKIASASGRPAVMIELIPNSYAILGADFHNQTWRLGAFDLMGNTLDTTSIYVAGTSPEESIRDLVLELKPFMEKLNIPVIPLIGLGMPGLIHTEQGIILSASDMNWFNINIKNIVDRELGWPSVILNRHRARGLSECRYGAGKEFQHMIYIGVGTGIAAGLFLDRQVISGAMGGSGEIGHTIIEPKGDLCACGNQGCLQIYAAGPAMEIEARKAIRQGETSSLLEIVGDLHLLRAEDICREADKGDALSIRIVNKAAEYMGIAMANLVNILNPEAIILGGNVAIAGKQYIQTAEAVMKQRAMSQLAAATKVTIATGSDIGGALGAANFAFDNHFNYQILNQLQDD